MSTNDEVAMNLLAGDALRHYDALLPVVNRVIAAYESFIESESGAEHHLAEFCSHITIQAMMRDNSSETKCRGVSLQAKMAASSCARETARKALMASVAALAKAVKP